MYLLVEQRYLASKNQRNIECARQNPRFRRSFAGKDKMIVADLITARTLLTHAKASAQWVALLFYGAGDAAMAARLNDIVAKLDDEIAVI